jgi:N-acetylglucosaminyldiphosphoundecaprenol N-acetyl-beta-D-mannosaminyltransferase
MMQAMKRDHESIRLLGVRVDNVSMTETIAILQRYLADGEPHQIATVNPEFVMEAQRNTVFRDVLQKSDLNVPDGVGLLLAARMRGQRLRERVTGVALTERLAALSAASGYRLFLLGAAPGVAESAAQVLEQRFPGVVIAGCYAGSPCVEDENTIRQIIAAARPDVLLVAYGAPSQDLWIARNQPPVWVQRLGLKWLHRLIQQPSRWRRIWTAVVRFPLAVARENVRT